MVTREPQRRLACSKDPQAPQLTRRAPQAKMDDMALEFGAMLNGTLAKMNERIELSTSNAFDSDAGVRMQRSVGAAP